MNVIIDTGCANLSSLKFAIERLDHRVEISADQSLINSADKVFLPGVGTAKHAMRNLRERDLDSTIKALTQPVLGICLGMQLLTEQSKEGPVKGDHANQIIDCLGIIPTRINGLSEGCEQPLRVPHMGWNTSTAFADHPLFKNIALSDYFYYVHSYAAPVTDYTIAQCRYNSYANPAHSGQGVVFSAALAKDNFAGVQFHPERSGKVGSLLLKNFLESKT
jgi:glutamine amidotransferase